MKVHAVLASAVILSACAGEVDDTSTDVMDGNPAAVIGGTVDEGDPAVAYLQVAQPAEDGFTEFSTCTASLIAPKVLLMAAHCVEPWLVENATITAFFGTDVFTGEGTWVNVKEVHAEPRYTSSNIRAGHDIAVGILEEPVPIAPLPYNRAPMTAADVGEPVRLIGFGRDEDWADGIKRHVSTTINTVTPTLLGLGDATHHTCTGDSGGPALMNVNGVPTIVGVTSFSTTGDFTICTDGWDARVDLSVDFIDQFVNAN
ncbi:trypsin-like serine protease [Sorangium cellulosum]|uniref:S1 family peptidase n=1 Tax=Sorangium cellulosum TaxID=56 RepID=UPI003D9A7A7F